MCRKFHRSARNIMRMSAGKFESFLTFAYKNFFEGSRGSRWPFLADSFPCEWGTRDLCLLYSSLWAVLYIPGRKFVKMVIHPLTLSRLQFFKGKGLSSCVISRLLRCKLSVSCPPHVLSFSENKWRKRYGCSTPGTSAALHSWLIISHCALRVGLYFFQCW